MHPTSTTFIYQPRSGDRVFAEGHRPSIAVLKHANGCRHVVGGVELRYFTARQGRAYWRGDAVALARALVLGYGGVAWDECGEIHLVVPVSAAVEVDALMSATRPRGCFDSPFDDEDRANRARLLISGAGYLCDERLCPTHEADPSIRAQHPWRVRAGYVSDEGETVAGQYGTAFDVLKGDQLFETLAVRYPWCPAELEPDEVEAK